jgi:RHS repeat-associated protein
VLSGSNILRQSNAVTTIDFYYEGSSDFGFSMGGSTYWYVKNLQGDVIGIINDSGTRVVTYTYDAWGKPVSVTGSLANTVGEANPLRYRGYYYDSETGFYYLNARYYDPEVGRFVNADGQLIIVNRFCGLNLFSYCMNNPVVHYDPTGCWTKGIGNLMGSVGMTYMKSLPVISNPLTAIASAASTLYAVSDKLPLTGESNSTQKTPDGSQERKYGPDERATIDTDYGHSDHHPNLKNPHDHDWEWDGDIPSRGKAHNFDWEVAVGIVLLVVCVILIVVIICEDSTGIGILDDPLLIPLTMILRQALAMAS